MINLELTEEEAENLYTLLGLHAVDSSIDTFSVFGKLNGQLPRRSAVQWMYDLNRTGLRETGAFYIS